MPVTAASKAEEEAFGSSIGLLFILMMDRGTAALPAS